MNEKNLEEKDEKKDKISNNEKDMKQEKNIVKEEKKEIVIESSYKKFKPFPIKLNNDFKLKKKYKSVQNYDNIQVITGTILPESNLILSGNIEGQLNTLIF